MTLAEAMQKNMRKGSSFLLRRLREDKECASCVIRSTQPARSADLGDLGKPQQAKIRLGSTQTLLATTSDFVIAMSDFSVHLL